MGKFYTIVSLIVGTLLFNTWVVAQEPQGNPKRGERIYKQHCLRCHGEKGDGFGPEAQYLIVKPANFLEDKSRMKTDFELLTIISHGVIFSPMHGWRDRLTQEEMLDVLSYIRFLSPFKAIAEIETPPKSHPTS